MKSVIFFTLFALLTMAGPARADVDQIYTGRQLGHPEFLQCRTTADCTIITTPTCSLQMAVNTRSVALAEEAAAKKIKCVSNFPPFSNPQPFCSMGECSMLVSSGDSSSDDQ